MKPKTSSLASKFSRIIAGTMSWGSGGKGFSRDEMISLMHSCLDSGISTFGNGDIYCGYTNEADFGNAFAEIGLSRGHIQLISKCGIQHISDSHNIRIKHYNYNKDYIVRCAEQSLERLRTDYLDLFLLHRPSLVMHPEEIATAIEHLLESGKIRHFGLSNFTPSPLALIESEIAVEGNQVEFSLTADRVMYDGNLDDYLLHSRVAMAWSPLGSYVGLQDNEQARIRQAMELLTHKYRASEMEWRLAWLLEHPANIFPVVGTTREIRLKQSANAINIQLESDDWFELLAAAQDHKVPQIK